MVLVFSSSWLTAWPNLSLLASRSSRFKSPCNTSNVTSDDSCRAFFGDGATHFPPLWWSSSEMSCNVAGRAVSLAALFLPAIAIGPDDAVQGRVADGLRGCSVRGSPGSRTGTRPTARVSSPPQHNDSAVSAQRAAMMAQVSCTTWIQGLGFSVQGFLRLGLKGLRFRV